MANFAFKFYKTKPAIKTASTIRGAGIFLVSSNIIVIIITVILSMENPLFCIRITAAIAIKPPATAVIPVKEIFIPFI
ncbi:MAG TPA: hypothetical protein VJ892_02460, partial [Candidatus Absconditabacterales bacterium]|nr:hypothetical protein [Candidatus Absconditabacterales bacterium]